MKKLVSVLLSVIMVVSILASNVITAAATSSSDSGEVTPMYLTGGQWTSYLSFSGKTAKCKSTVVLAPDEKWISINQRLEKQTSSGTWELVLGASWNAMSFTDSHYYIFNNLKTVTSSGNYRVKSTFVVESATGVRETIILYSKTVTI